MAPLHEASFYERLPDNRVHCTLCPHQCRIGDGSRGACAVRFNQGGVLYTVVYDRIVARDVEPIEKKPLFHFVYHSLGVWVEVTTLVIPGVNDSDRELRQIAEFVRSVGPEVPWHVSQFHPAYKMLDRPVTPVETLRRARDIGLSAGLFYVYEGNVPGEVARCLQTTVASPPCSREKVPGRGSRPVFAWRKGSRREESSTACRIG